MQRTDLQQLPAAIAPPPYTLRQYRAGDEEAWAGLMNHGLGHGWRAHHFWERFGRDREFLLGGLFFAEARGTVAGTASAGRGDCGSGVGVVQYVVVAPAHRGHGLAAPLSAAVLAYLRDQGFESAMLATSERRLAAIKTYFRLGFTPLYRGNGDGARWERVLGRVGSHDGKDGVL